MGLTMVWGIVLWFHRNPDPTALYHGSVSLGRYSQADLSIGFGDRSRQTVHGSQGFSVPASTITTGIATAVTPQGQLVGMTVVPKDAQAFKTTPVSIDFRSTALALVASSPGMSQPNPIVATVELGLVAKTPELVTLTNDLAAQAAADPSYLAHPDATVVSDLDAVEGAFIVQANNYITSHQVSLAPKSSWLDTLVPDAYADSDSSTSTSSDSSRPAFGSSCDENDSHLKEVYDKEIDGVCLKLTGSNILQLTNHTERWGLYYLGSSDLVPAAIAAPKTWALPTVEQLVETITKLSAQSALQSVGQLGSLIGLKVQSNPEPIQQQLMDAMKAWDQNTQVTAVLPDSSSQRTLSEVSTGFPRSDESVQGLTAVRFGGSTVMTIATQVAIPLISMALDTKSDSADPSQQEGLVQAVLDFVQNNQQAIGQLTTAMTNASQLSASQRAALVAQYLAQLSGETLTDKGMRSAMIKYAFNNLADNATDIISSATTNILLDSLAAPVAAVKLAIDEGVPAINLSLNVVQLYQDSWDYGVVDDYSLGSTNNNNASTSVRKLGYKFVHDNSVKFPNGQYSINANYVQITGASNLEAVNKALYEASKKDEDQLSTGVAKLQPSNPGCSDGGCFYYSGPSAQVNDPDAELVVSASTAVVSVLIPVSNENGGEHDVWWIPVTLKVPSAQPIKLSNLFTNQSQALSVISAIARNQLTNSVGCVAQGLSDPMSGPVEAAQFAPTEQNYNYFALTTEGIVIGFVTGQVADVACGEHATTISWDSLRPYLSPSGQQIVADLR